MEKKITQLIAAHPWQATFKGGVQRPMVAWGLTQAGDIIGLVVDDGRVVAVDSLPEFQSFWHPGR